MEKKKAEKMLLEEEIELTAMIQFSEHRESGLILMVTEENVVK